MSATTATRPASTDLAWLDELVRSEELWSDRGDEAQAIARHLLQTASPIVVLHGPRRSGKTELIRRHVVPLVSEHRRVRFRGAPVDTGSSEPGEAGTIEFWDSFESDLRDDASERDDVIREVSRAVTSAPGCRLVLIIADEALNRLFQLCAVIPRIVEDIVEIPRIGTRPLFDRIARNTALSGVTVAESFFTALKRELTAGSAAVSSELAAILVFELCRLKPDANEATGEYYESRGGLPGMLEAHLNYVLDRLPDGLDPQIGWAVLEEVVARRDATAQSPDLVGIANRFAVAPEIPAQVLRWLEETRRIVQRRTTGEFDLVPPQLALAVRAKQQRDAIADEPHRWVLRQATRNVVDAEALLSEPSFRRIHAYRTALKTSEEEAKLMLRCALAYEDTTLDGATSYWLRRVSDPAVQVDLLLEAVFDSRPDVRRRAAKHLSAFPRPDVRNQLHLLALRDPADTVRGQAIESLDTIKDPDLLTSLIQELREPNSPYRVQAIDALRIFDAPAATNALVGIVRKNDAGADLEARHRAIDVLGRQQTTDAAEALLNVALQDRDPEDRERAAQALGSMSSTATLRFVLNRLHDQTHSASAWRISWSWRAVGLWMFYAALGMGAVLANLFIHGFVLMTMRRWRLGIGISILGGLALFVLNSATVEYDGIGAVLLYSATLLAGLLISFRLLVLERLAGIPPSRYRRSLGMVVFASCLAPFLYLHGLPCMLTKRFRRGLLLVLFEMLGVLVLLGAIYMWDEFGAFNELSRAFTWTWWSSVIIGSVLLTTTLLVGIGSVWLDAFGFQRRRTQLRRIGEVQNALSSNRLVPALLLADCLGGARHKARWSRRALRTFGRGMRDGLRDSWDEADSPTRRKIFSIMARRHDPESMDFLQTATRSLDWRARIQYLWASLAFRMALWPKPLLVAIAIVLYGQVAALTVLIVQSINQPSSLQGKANDPDESLDDRTEAIEGLRRLAQQRLNSEVSNAAVASLANVVSRLGPDDNELRLVGLGAVAAVAPSAEETQRRQLVDAVASLMKETPLQEEAVTILRAIRTVEAATALKQFIERPVSAARLDEDVAIRRMAIAALATIPGGETVDALTELSQSATLRSELKEAASAAVSADPLIRAEAALEYQQYDEAVNVLRAVLADGSLDQPRTTRAKEVLNRAYTAQGSIAFDDNRFADAKASLLAALDPTLSAATGGDLLTLGLNLSYEFHERQAPTNPAAYREAYDVMSKLLAFNGDDEDKLTIQANLAEVSLTTGRYDEAVRLARDLIDRPGVDAANTLAMKFMVYAALALSKQSSDAALREVLAYYQTRPAGFTAGWAYMGTRSYIERAPVSASEKARILEVLGTIEEEKK